MVTVAPVIVEAVPAALTLLAVIAAAIAVAAAEMEVKGSVTVMVVAYYW